MTTDDSNDLDATGVSVCRAVCDPSLCAALLAEIQTHLTRLSERPQTMAERMRQEATGPTCRHFLPISTVRGSSLGGGTSEGVGPDFDGAGGGALPLSPAAAAVLKSALGSGGGGGGGGGVGALLAAALGGVDAVVSEMTAIASDPGAAAQAVHSDGDWREGAPRLVTLFLALHDVLDPSMGPTRYWPRTHTPRCFAPEGSAEGAWLPPTEERARERRAGGGVWFPLKAGDAVLMEQTAWHHGGANTSTRRRTLLSVSFVAAPTAGGGRMEQRDADGDKLRLRDFL